MQYQRNRKDVIEAIQVHFPENTEDKQEIAIHVENQVRDFFTEAEFNVSAQKNPIFAKCILRVSSKPFIIDPTSGYAYNNYTCAELKDKDWLYYQKTFGGFCWGHFSDEEFKKLCSPIDDLKSRVIERLEIKQRSLELVHELQQSEKKKSKLNDLDKNEIELKAQIAVLSDLLSN